MDCGRLPIQVAAGIVEAQALPARKLRQVDHVGIDGRILSTRTRAARGWSTPQ
jgi:hypothetical protein